MRSAVEQDGRFVWRLTMDATVVAQSSRGRRFSLDEHLGWWAARVTDPDTRMFISEEDGQPVGYVRFDARGTGRDRVVYVSIATLPEARRRGHARALLLEPERVVRDELGTGRLVALVLTTNLASRKLFATCGYECVGEREILGRTHRRYEKHLGYD